MQEPIASIWASEPDSADDVFIDFYRARYPRAVQLAGSLVGPSDLAEDVVQDVFAALHRQFGQVRNPASYLRMGIVNRSRNVWRGRDYERRRLLGLRPVHVPATSSSEMFDVLMKLPSRQRTVLVLRYWNDWSDAEIAEALRCRPGAVKQLAHRGLVRLRKEILP